MLNIDKLIACLEAEEYGFDMSDWVVDDPDDALDERMLEQVNACGTVACIGGTADLIRYREKAGTDDTLESWSLQWIRHSNGSDYDTFRWICEGLTDRIEVSHDTATLLFCPETEYACFWDEPGDSRFVTRKHAIAVLKHLRDTGEVDWSVEPGGDRYAEYQQGD